MLVKLFILFTIVPCLELALLIKIGGSIGMLETVLLIIITGMAGAAAVRAAGLQCLVRIQAAMREGIAPTEELFNGLLILVAGAMLITPGVLTDCAGFLLLVPTVRAGLRQRLQQLILTKFSTNVIVAGHTDSDYS